MAVRPSLVVPAKTAPQARAAPLAPSEWIAAFFLSFPIIMFTIIWPLTFEGSFAGQSLFARERFFARKRFLARKRRLTGKWPLLPRFISRRSVSRSPATSRSLTLAVPAFRRVPLRPVVKILPRWKSITAPPGVLCVAVLSTEATSGCWAALRRLSTVSCFLSPAFHLRLRLAAAIAAGITVVLGWAWAFLAWASFGRATFCGWSHSL
jgi:hypothetical protein